MTSKEFDLLLAMDHGHYDAMNRGCPPELLQRVRMFMDYAPDAGTRDVPDPYYGTWRRLCPRIRYDRGRVARPAG